MFLDAARRVDSLPCFLSALQRPDWGTNAPWQEARLRGNSFAIHLLRSYKRRGPVSILDWVKQTGDTFGRWDTSLGHELQEAASYDLA